MPKVTVAMSSYNHGKYVGEAIESVLNQTYGDFEFLIADDGSSDNSVEVIKSYKDKRIRFFEFGKNTGFKTWDPILEQAAGEYITVIGSDDVWRNDKLEKQIAFLEKHPMYAACFSWLDTIDENSKIITDERLSKNKDFNKENKTSEQWFYDLFFGRDSLAAPTFMMKTEIFREFDGFNYKYRQIQDYELWLRFLQKYKLYVLQEPLLFYRWHIRDAVCNISAPSKESSIRTYNEKHYMFRDMIEHIDDAFFIRTFQKRFLNAESHTTEQVMCEKFFLLINYPGSEGQQCGIDYYLAHIDEEGFRRCLEEEYGFQRVDFYQLEAERGTMVKICELENVIAQYKELLGQAMYCIEEIQAQKGDDKNALGGK